LRFKFKLKVNNLRGGDFSPGAPELPYDVVIGDVMRGMLYRAE
jgi:hypothetical protein